MEIGISTTVTSIGDSVFSEFMSLEKLTFLNPSCLTSIGANFFFFLKCSYLKQINIPFSVTSKENAFSYCCSLKKLLESLGKKVFYNCSSLEHIEIPPSVKKIAYNAFFKFKSLRQ